MKTTDSTIHNSISTNPQSFSEYSSENKSHHSELRKWKIAAITCASALVVVALGFIAYQYFSSPMPAPAVPSLVPEERAGLESTIGQLTHQVKDLTHQLEQALTKETVLTEEIALSKVELVNAQEEIVKVQNEITQAQQEIAHSRETQALMEEKSTFLAETVKHNEEIIKHDQKVIDTLNANRPASSGPTFTSAAIKVSLVVLVFFFAAYSKKSPYYGRLRFT